MNEPLASESHNALNELIAPDRPAGRHSSDGIFSFNPKQTFHNHPPNRCPAATMESNPCRVIHREN
jgi:hypothetical protein